jgi:hypothetical protein
MEYSDIPNSFGTEGLLSSILNIIFYNLKNSKDKIYLCSSNLMF